VPTRVSADEFVKAWTAAGGSPTAVAQSTGLTLRNVYARRARLEKLNNIALPTNDAYGRDCAYAPAHFERRRKFEVTDGVVVVFSDPHWLPDHGTVGQNALEVIIGRYKPQLIVCGGDALDGNTISRFDPTRGHHKRFSVREELDTCVAHFTALQAVAGKARLAWTLGNHDVRLSRYVAVQAPYMLDMPFTRLDDWFPAWPLSWTVEINSGTPGMTVIRHRNQAGMLHLQAQKAGVHYVHGHLHRLNVHRAATYAGVRYSVDTGSLADPASDAFDYAEGGPDHAQGFAVLTFRDGMLLPPELCEIVRGKAYFRGCEV
jgi:UDP-2,3-diacylglucosamine pyrophosphatase LpxH